MSISRRQFLLSSPATGAGLILPSAFDRLFNHFEITGEPLLLKPKRQVTVLNAFDSGYVGYQLNLGDPYAEPGPLTLREYLREYTCMEFEDYVEELQSFVEGPVNVSLDDEVPMDDWIDSWGFTESPRARAFYLLLDLDLGADFSGPNTVGEIQFIDGPCPGSNYLGVHAVDVLSLSLLQHRLNQLDTGIVINMI